MSVLGVFKPNLHRSTKETHQSRLCSRNSESTFYKIQWLWGFFLLSVDVRVAWWPKSSKADHGSGPFCVLPCLLGFSPTVQKHAGEVNWCVWFFICVPCNNLATCLGCTMLSLKQARIGSSNCNAKQDRKLIDWWMDRWTQKAFVSKSLITVFKLTANNLSGLNSVRNQVFTMATNQLFKIYVYGNVQSPHSVITALFLTKRHQRKDEDR